MLTHPISLAIWRKIASAPDGWAEQNIPLLAKSALLVYRKCGRNEAQIFINLVRACLLTGL